MIRSLFFMLALVLPGLSLAQDSDTQEISRYVLTDAALAKYVDALNGLRPLATQIASCDDEEGVASLSELTARAERVPAVKTVIQSAGLTTREWVVFGLAMFQTGMAVWALEQAGGRLPPGVSQANVDFYRKHRARIESLAPLDDGCEDSSGGEDPEE